MDILQMRYFYDSANYLSISKTAEKYGVPATSVSASIKRLEGDLGCKLFDRLPNRIVLNEKGRLMRDHLKVIFDEMDDMLGAVSQSADDNKEIKLSVRSARSMITDCIISFKNKYSNTRFFLDTDYEDINPENYDIIIDQKSDKYEDYDYITVKKNPLYIFAAENTGLSSKKLKLADLKGEPFVVISRNGNHAKALVSACENAGFSPKITAQVNDSACFRKIIASGIAIGVSGFIPGDSEQGVSRLNVTDFKCEQEICAYYKPKNLYGNTARFISFLTDFVNSANKSYI